MKLIATNTFGTISLSKAVLPHFIEKKGGQFVVIRYIFFILIRFLEFCSSVSGRLGAPLSSGYSASKFALHGFFEALRSEQALINNIDVTMVCPGKNTYPTICD